MKRLLFFSWLAFLAAPVWGQSNLREVDLRVNGVASGTSYATVIKKLGRPGRKNIVKYEADDTCSDEAQTHVTLFYTGLEIKLLGAGRGRQLDVYSVEVTSVKWTANGIRIGANIKNVLDRFGKPNSRDQKSNETVLRYVTKENLGVVNFYFRNNKLVKIVMEETLC